MTTPKTRVAIGLPVLNGADYLEEALGSLLAQSYEDFVVVVVDNCSTDATPEIIGRLAAEDARVVRRRNPETVGAVENWRRTFRAAVEECPDLEYFAWGSAHDVWYPRWLETMIRELDADPAAVAAFPLWVPLREDGTRWHWRPRQRWDTAGIADPARRVLSNAPGTRIPNVIYGLFRARALERCGIYPMVLAPDRLLMSQLSFLGTFRQVAEELWMRRMWSSERAHQRTRVFNGRPPFHAYLPTGLVHAVMLFRWAVLEGRARPEVSRARALPIAAVYLRRACIHPTLRKKKRTEKWITRRRKWLKRQRVRLKPPWRWLKGKWRIVRRFRRRAFWFVLFRGRAAVHRLRGHAERR